MKLQPLKPHKMLNKAYLKEKVSRNYIELFKANLSTLLSKINPGETEEHHKTLLADFLKNTWYKDLYEINTKGRTDLVIHNGKTTKDTVGVIIEVKSPSNKAEMITDAKPNVKAMHELILYYLRERLIENNTDVKRLVITNINEWFIFDEADFDKLFFRNNKLKSDFENHRLSGKDTKFFFESIAKSFIDNHDEILPCTYFDIRDYEKVVRNTDKKDDNKLIALYKILSPSHLLIQPFANDSNSLDKKFYAELLHIIGLEEKPDGGKKLIDRKTKPDAASLLESTLQKLEDKDCLHKVTGISNFGATTPERLYNVALELCITWINRVLFIKLLEGQMVTYHKGDKEYKFLNTGKIPGFYELNDLFFLVLAQRTNTRREHLKDKFSCIPYLNSSLFDQTQLEKETIEISELNNRLELPVLPATVLKDDKGKKHTGALSTLQYLFDFLDAYDFSSDGGEQIQEENKNLINASVLGLIFEKINGYKDGSFFTPGFITQYMCRETIRRAVLQKFKEVKGWECENICPQLYDKISDKKEANSIINSLKICDPAVGSGHFLVSALNEVIAIKGELHILQDRQHKTLRDYNIEVVNDELVITDEDGKLLDYNPTNKESQRIQEALFHEKETIIESCLFGVDINPNSVKICRLRLWIELLKNAYYTAESNFTELETLPNIDINIKCGNSLISRFALDADLSKALKKSKWTIDSYRIAVQTYRSAESKEEKRAMEELINSIKTNFRTEISNSDPKIKKLQKLNTEYHLKHQGKLFDGTLTKAQKKDKEKFEDEIAKLDTDIKEIKSNKIYENAFEWRFEFPEVLDNDGSFIGFDMVIGNPPYGVNLNKSSSMYFESYYQVFNLRGESYTLFVEKAISLMKSQGSFSYIIPDTLLNLGFTDALRNFLLKQTKILEVDLIPSKIFNDATVDTILLFASKGHAQSNFNINDVTVNVFDKKDKIASLSNPLRTFEISTTVWANQKAFNLQGDEPEISLIQKLDKSFPALTEFAEIFSGVKTYEVGKGSPQQTEEIRKQKPYTSVTQIDTKWLPFFDGKHIGRYSLVWKNNNWINYGPWLAAPRRPENFKDDKILIRKITGKTLIATYVSYTSYCNTLLFVLKLKPDVSKISYKAILGILNSNFIGWYFRKKYQISDSDTFPQIMIRDILEFSIPNVSNPITSDIARKVGSLLQGLDLSLEQEIDQLVYQLYGLTEEEIKIVEGV